MGQTISLTDLDMEDEPSRPFPTYDSLSYSDYLVGTDAKAFRTLMTDWQNHHLLPNKPFVLSAAATKDWPCSKWRLAHPGQPGPSRPNLRRLEEFRHHVVPVADTRSREFSEFKRQERLLGDVLDEWEAGLGDGLYVKDWHLFEVIEGEGKDVRSVYTVPECLQDDWLNPAFDSSLRPHSLGTDDEHVGDFRFCYMGPAGTFTPLHRDVYASYSWSANVVGRKKWWFFPPDNLSKVKDNSGDLVFDVRQLPDEGGASQLIQEEGEIVFVPSGWHHQVLNLDFCVSINHNFFSLPTLGRVFDTQVLAQKRVEASISDILPMVKERLGEDGPWEAEWVSEVQSLLKMDVGWDWQGFWETTRRNVCYPTATSDLRPPRAFRDITISTLIDRYKAFPEWTFLEETRKVILDIERLLAYT